MQKCKLQETFFEFTFSSPFFFASWFTAWQSLSLARTLVHERRYTRDIWVNKCLIIKWTISNDDDREQTTVWSAGKILLSQERIKSSFNMTECFLTVAQLANFIIDCYTFSLDRAHTTIDTFVFRVEELKIIQVEVNSFPNWQTTLDFSFLQIVIRSNHSWELVVRKVIHCFVTDKRVQTR